MSNDYFNATGTPARRSFAASQPIESEYDLIEQGFDKFPSITATYMMVGAAGGTAWEAKSPAQVRVVLGGTTVGQAFFTLTNPSAITFPRINADNTVSALSAADMKTALGVMSAVTASGTVAGLTLTATGTTTVNIALGGTLAVNLATQVTGILPVVNGGSGSSTAEGGRTALGLGTMSTQNKEAVDIQGGTIIETTIVLKSTTLSISTGTLNVDVSTASLFRVTVGENFQVNIEGAPSDPEEPVPFVIRCTNSGSFDVTSIVGSGITVYGWNEQTINLKANGLTDLECLLMGSTLTVKCFQWDAV